jgi:RNA polymerase sigma factor (sigma-70 family)
VTTPDHAEDLLRDLAPKVLGVVTRRCGDFSDAEDAVQEALIAAATTWPTEGRPENPAGWLVRVAQRRVIDQHRGDEARRRRERMAASWSLAGGDEVSGEDDSLVVMFMCCHPALTPGAAIPLTLRAVGGLTTREIANAFLVPEPTMAQRITRAKAKVKAAGATFAMPPTAELADRLRSILHVLYLLFNEGYATSDGPDLGRSDLSTEAIRLTRGVHDAMPDDPEVESLLALMLLTDARRPARTDADGELVPLEHQDRSRWSQDLVVEGEALLTDARRRGHVGEYQLQAEIAAAHDRAATYDETDWRKILSFYELLEQLTSNPMVRLNRAVAATMVDGPAAGLALLDGLDVELGDHHRLHAVRGHLLERAGDNAAAAEEFRAAAAGTTNLRERTYLTTKAASVRRW